MQAFLAPDFVYLNCISPSVRSRNRSKSLTEMCAKYIHGHSPGVLKSHRWRTASNSAGYLLKRLTPETYILDVGCGPGTITKDFAQICHEGIVVGVDAAECIIEQAKLNYPETEYKNMSFTVGSVFSLPFPENSFDVVHAHQLLQHVEDPAKALQEMKRVCKDGGVVAARDADYAGFIWAPEDDRLNRWRTEYLRMAYANRGDPNAGRNLLHYAVTAGFSDIECTASTWCFANPNDREWWGSLWAERIMEGTFADQMRAQGLGESALQSMAQGFLNWSACKSGWFLVPHGEIICRK